MNTTASFSRLATLASLLLLWGAGSALGERSHIPDTIPAPVLELRSPAQDDSIFLRLSLPPSGGSGQNWGDAGQEVQVTLKYSEVSGLPHDPGHGLTLGEWEAYAAVGSFLMTYGSSLDVDVTGLTAQRSWCFAARTSDGIHDSNFATFHVDTLADGTSPPAFSIAVSSESGGSLALSWSAAHDIDDDGADPDEALTYYELRWSATGPIMDDAAWNAATPVQLAFGPGQPGNAEPPAAVTGLPGASVIHLALRAWDNGGNRSHSMAAGVTPVGSVGTSGGGDAGGCAGSAAGSGAAAAGWVAILGLVFRLRRAPPPPRPTLARPQRLNACP